MNGANCYGIPLNNGEGVEVVMVFGESFIADVGGLFEWCGSVMGWINGNNFIYCFIEKNKGNILTMLLLCLPAKMLNYITETGCVLIFF